MPESDPPPTPPDPLLPRPPAPGTTQWRPPQRVQPGMRYPIGPPYDIGPELFPPGVQRPATPPGFDYPPHMPGNFPGFIGFEPPIYLPGQPIPPGMPPAWNGGPTGSRPPFPWEPTMIDPSWNPDSNKAPKHIPNPKYDPNWKPPAVGEPVVPRPGVKVPSPPAALPDTVIVEIPIIKPPGAWPAIAGGFRFVLGIAGGAAAIHALFSEGDHFDQAKNCFISFFSKIGYSTDPDIEFLGTSEAERMYEGIRIKKDDEAQLTAHLKEIIQKGCDYAGFNPADFNMSGACAPFVQNMLAAIMLCRCKKSPPDPAPTNALKAALLARIAQYKDADAAMLGEMSEAEQLARSQVDWYAITPSGNWCKDKWQERLTALKAIIEARTYVVTFYDLKRNADKVDPPTCENRISQAAVDAYFQALNKAMDAAVAHYQAAQAAWDAWKQQNPDPSAVGCPVINQSGQQ